MRDGLLALLLMAVLAGWFSINGPVALPDTRPESGWVMPGEEGGQTELVVSGAGAEIADAPDPEPQGLRITTGPEATTPSETTPETAEEEDMDNVSNLIWFAAGVVSVLIGEVSGPLVAGLWRRVRGWGT